MDNKRNGGEREGESGGDYEKYEPSWGELKGSIAAGVRGR